MLEVHHTQMLHSSTLSSGLLKDVKDSTECEIEFKNLLKNTSDEIIKMVCDRYVPGANIANIL